MQHGLIFDLDEHFNSSDVTMATALHVSFSGRSGQLPRLLAGLRRYRAALRDIAALGQRELDDLDLSRADLRAIAWQEAFGN